MYIWPITLIASDFTFAFLFLISLCAKYRPNILDQTKIILMLVWEFIQIVTYHVYPRGGGGWKEGGV